MLKLERITRLAHPGSVAHWRRRWSAGNAVAGQTLCYGTIDLAGYANVGACSSDERRKHDIAPLPDGALAKIAKLSPVNFVANGYTRRQAGFIAQQAMQVIPESVPPIPNSEYLGFDEVSVLAYTVKAVQELSAKVERLERRRAQKR